MAPQKEVRSREPADGVTLRPGRVAILYAILAAAWIAAGSLADTLILNRNPEIELLVETVKGMAFVAGTALLLYLLLARVHRRLRTVQHSLDESRQTTEAEHRRIERIARIGHWSWRADPGSYDWAGGRSVYSESAAAIFGVTPADMALSNRDYVDRFVHPDDRLRVARYFSESNPGKGGTTLAEYRIVRPDGAIRTIYEVTEIASDEGDGPRHWQGTVQDVTDIRAVEASLAESEARFRDFTEIASHFQWELDDNLRITSFSGQRPEMIASNERDVIGRTFQEVAGVEAADAGGHWKAFADLLRSHEPFDDFAYSVRTGPGQIRYRRASGRPIFDANGRFKGYRGVTRDETREVEARQRAQAAEELLARAVESISDGFAIYDSDDRLIMMNNKFRESFPRNAPADPIGKTFEELIRADVALGYYPMAAGREEAFIAERLAAHRRTGAVFIFKNDYGRWVQARDQVLPDGSIVAIRTDVTELAERDEALRKSQANLAAAQRIAKMGSWEFDLENLDDLDRNPLRWSDEAFRILGLEPGKFSVSNEAFYRLVPEEDRARIRLAVEQAVREGIPYNVEHRMIRPDGTEIVIRDMAEVVRDPLTSRPVKMVGTVQDITQMARTEEALRQAQKMEAMGQLTGGVAHDFNNLLMVIGGNLELLQEGIEANQPRLRRFADVALDAVTRGSQLTQRLLAFARRQSLKSEVIDLNRLIGSLVPLLHRTLGEQVTVETALSSDLWPVLCDASQLENALLNLAVNARDAMPERGRLVIRSENLHLDRGWAGEAADLSPGDYVMLAVSDTDQGMSATVRERAFEPFFTTKETGKGTGLGLSMVYGFVKQSGGHIKIDSEPGQGTTVRLFLPRSDEGARTRESPHPESLPPRGSERILLVEDEDIVRATVAAMLQDLGYRVSEATEGNTALSMIAGDPSFDLVLSDMVMPGDISGWDLAERAWRLRPGLKFLFSTGYTDNPILRRAQQDGRIQVLAKPYNLRALALMLRAVIERPANRPPQT